MSQREQLEVFYKKQRNKRDLQNDMLYVQHGIAWIKCIRSIINTRYGAIISKKELLEVLDKLAENDVPSESNNDVYKTYTKKDITMLYENERLYWNADYGIIEKPL
jgi:hypothetical protein